MEQGCLAPACRGCDKGKWAPDGCVHPLREPWARYYMQAGRRDRDFRRQQVEERRTGGRGGWSGSRRVSRTERVGWVRFRCSLYRQQSSRFMKPGSATLTDSFLGLLIIELQCS